MNYSDKQEIKKGPIILFIEKWIIVIVLYSLSAFMLILGVWLNNKHYPTLSELQYVSGDLDNFSIIDGFRNHRITMKLRETSIPFIFTKVNYFPVIKKNISLGSHIEMWVDKDDFVRRKSPEIWQLSINNKIMMSRDSISSFMKDGSPGCFKNSLYLFLAGSFFLLILKSKNAFITEKVYPAILGVIAIACIIVYFYFAFYKGGLK